MSCSILIDKKEGSMLPLEIASRIDKNLLCIIRLRINERKYKASRELEKIQN